MARADVPINQSSTQSVFFGDEAAFAIRQVIPRATPHGERYSRPFRRKASIHRACSGALAMSSTWPPS
jgi:hypothetical protein